LPRGNSAARAVVLHYGDSGDVSGQSSVVGYLAARSELFHDDEDERRSCSLAGMPSTAVCRRPAAAADPGALADRRAGVFVTIYHSGQLRGCIGHEADQPLPLSRAARSPRAASSRSLPSARRNCGSSVGNLRARAMEPVVGRLMWKSAGTGC
jgi:hypothetical protein